MAESNLESLIAIRREKADTWVQEGEDITPYSYPGTTAILDVRAPYDNLQDGEETTDTFCIAGRLMARRGQGKVAFLDIVDRSGKIQGCARLDILGQDKLTRIISLDLGDLIGVTGTIFKTPRGELSLLVTDYQILSKSLRPIPDKHDGLVDTETRYRHRELDLIANEESRDVFIKRSKIVSAIRRYLDDAGYLEVETPVLQPIYGGALARPFTTHHNKLDRELYLRIATELYLKKLIVGGLERVYELGKDFRNEGLSPKHNPEFTMVEFYAALLDYNDQAVATEELIQVAALAAEYDGPLNFVAPFNRITYVGAIIEHTAINGEPGLNILDFPDIKSLSAEIERRQLALPTNKKDWGQLVDDIFSAYVEPHLTEPTFVFDFPIEISPFARPHRQDSRLAERFELFIGGMELANAFSEINDPDMQRERFEVQRKLGEAGNHEIQLYDQSYIEALESGMPPASGVGLGIDRLVMLLTGQETIREVILFPTLRS